MSKCFCCGAKYDSGPGKDGCTAGCYFPRCGHCNACVNHCRCAQPRFDRSTVEANERREARMERKL